MRRILLFLLFLLSAVSMARAQNRGIYMNYPDTVCLNNYASLHAFYRDTWDDDEDEHIMADAITWQITRPNGTSVTYRVGIDSMPPPFLFVNPQVAYGARPTARGQSVMLDMNQVGQWTITVTMYDGRRSNGSYTYTNTRTRYIRVIDCAMSQCFGDFKPESNFLEDFGTFTENGPRRPVSTGTIEYQYNSNPYISSSNTSNGWPLSDDWYTVYYNAIKGGRPEWDNVDDHTNNGFGGMLIANSSETPKMFYKREVPGLCPGAKYNFSAWFINLNSHQVLASTCAGSDANYQYAGVEFIVRDASNTAVIGRFYTGDVSMDLRRMSATGDARRLMGWQKFGGTVTLPPGVTDVTVEIRNRNPGGCGNDIAVDDIAFEFCAPNIYTYIDGHSSRESVCPGAGLTVTSLITPAGYFDSPVYYWEYRKDTVGGSWIPVPSSLGITGITTPTLTIPENLLKENETWQFRLMVIESGNLSAGQSQCYTPSTPVTISVLEMPEIRVPRDSLCRGETLVLTAHDLKTPTQDGYEEFTFTGNYILPWPSGPQPVNQILIQPAVTSQYIVAGTARYGRFANGQPRFCTRRDSITIYVDAPPTVNIGPDTVVCAGTAVTLDAGAANAGFNIRWLPSQATTRTVSVTAPSIDGDSVKPFVQVRNGQCLVSDTMKITAVNLPQIALELPITVCTTPAATRMTVKPVAFGTDVKTPYTIAFEIVGPANGASLVANPGNPNWRDIINMTPNVPVRVRVTVTSDIADCGSSVEQDYITFTQPTAQITDAEIYQCDRDFVLTAVPLTDTSLIGTWVAVTPNVTIPAAEIHNPNATATHTGAAGTSARVRWEVTKRNGNASCPTARSADIYLRFNNPPTLQLTNPNVAVCVGSPFTFSVPYRATGSPNRYNFEAIAPGMPGFTDIRSAVLPSSSSGTITITYPGAVTAGTYQFRMTVLRGWSATDTCTASQIVTVVVNTPSTTPVVTISDAEICAGESTTLSITGGTLGSNAEWVWYRGDCASGVEIARNVTSITVSPTANATYSVHAVGTTACASTSCVSTAVTVYQQPAVPNAGPDQEQCNEELFQLAASAPSVPGAVGTWTANPASVVFSDIHDPNATARVFVGTTAVLTWTITNGACTTVSDQVSLTNLNEINQNIIREDQTICPGATPAQIYDVGHPSSGTGTFTYRWQSSTTSATAGYTTIPGATGEYYQPGALSVTTWFRRIVISGACTDTSAPVRIRVSNQPPTVATTPPAVSRECQQGFDYTTLFGTPTFQHPLGLALTITQSDNTVPRTCGMTITRTWTATDPCGLSVSTSQTITVTDNTRPVLTWTGSAPANITVNCDAIPVRATPGVTDNCLPAGASITPDYDQDTVRTAGACLNNYVLVRTWTATDACGNTVSHEQRITVQDTTRPVISFPSGTPADITVNCDAIPATVTASATDNCTPANLVRIVQSTDTVRTAGACLNNYVLVRTWTARDTCGNTASFVQRITVQDTTRPTMSWTGGNPANVTVNCNAIPAAVNPTTSDNCLVNGVTVRLTYTQDTSRTAGACVNNYVLVRTWTARDTCGNTATYVQRVTVQDTTRPTMSWAGGNPANVTVNCDAIPAAVNPTTSDNCLVNGVTVRLTYTQDTSRTAGACVNNYVLVRTWTARDTCGNTATYVQRVTVQDTTRPTMSWAGGNPANVTVNCNAIPAAVNPTVSDNCLVNGVTVRLTYTQDTSRTAGACLNNYVLVRTWTARDTCGNILTHVQRVTVQDTTRPTMSWAGGNPANVTVNCDAIPAAVNPTTNDNCLVNGATVRLTYTQDTSRTSGACLNNYVLVRTWTARDTCGNTATYVQRVTVQDTTRPTMTWAGGNPANVTVNCDAIPAAVNPTTSDNCLVNGATVRLTYTQDTSRAAGACLNNYVLVRTWTARDTCGNTLTHVQRVTVQDTTRPTMTWTGGNPANVTVNCDAIPAAVNPATSDNCLVNGATVRLTYTQDTSRTAGACLNNYVLVRTWTARDTCGNAISHVQRITVQDTTRPVISFPSGTPADITVNCDAIPATVTASATDNCTPANLVRIVQSTDTVRTAGACLNNYVLVRTWTARDTCGNTASFVQRITVQDTTRPTMSWTGGNPANVTVNCNAIPAAVNPTTSDNCLINGVTVRLTYTQDTSRTAGACVNNYVLVRTWTARDTCGNTATYVQRVTVQDTTRPTMSWAGGNPANVTVNCDAIPAAVNPTTSDNCLVNGVTVRLTYTQDTSRTAGACVNNYVLVRTWTARDTCGNTATYVQRVTVQDTTRPTMSWTGGNPANVTVNCNAIPAAVNPTVSDNCLVNGVTVRLTYTQDTSRTAGACLNNYVLVRTWTARDTCGNTLTHVQRVTVQDTTRPTMSWAGGNPANVTVNCDAIPAAVNPTTNDNCLVNGATVRLTYTQDTSRTSGACLNNYVLVRTWTARDTCGNTATYVQRVTVQDTTRPTMTWAGGNPANVTVNCDAIPAAVNPTTSDNCLVNGATVRLTYTQDTSRAAGACLNNYVLVRTWTARDTCGNTLTHVQRVTVQDTIRPTMTWAGGNPANVTVNCDAIPAAVNPATSDNCLVNGATVRLTYTQDTSRTAGACLNNYVLVRTWTARDTCGNAISHVQRITVQDTTRPVISFPSGTPADITVNCDAIPATVTASATDNCTPANLVRIVQSTDTVRTAGACLNNYVLVRTWTARDTCGNTASFVQRITVQDTTRPTMSWTGGNPANVTVNCNAIPAAVNPTTSDNCLVNGVTVRLTYTQDTSRTAGACVNNYVLVRTWTARDTCGNTATYVQRVTVQDTTRPTMSWAGGNPANVTVNCDAIPAAVNPTTSDNCLVNGVTVRLTYTQDTSRTAGACVNNYVLVRTWTARDTCGNTATYVQRVTVQDTTRPTMSWAGGNPANVTVNCNAIPAAVNPTVSDNCLVNGVTVRLTYTQDTSRTAGACLNNYVLVRTWTARDTCGNILTHVQRVTVQDTTRPTMSWAGGNPANVTVNCDAIPAAVNPTTNDNCLVNGATVRLTYTQDTSRTSGACLNNYVLVRTWTARDTCGNTATYVQRVTVQDTTRPVLTWTGAPPANMTVNCNAIPVAATAGATDNCVPAGTTIIPVYTQDTVRAAGACLNNYVLVRTWTARDTCGNAISHVQRITVQDTTRPVLTWTGSAPANITVNCDAIPAAATAGATDNCVPAGTTIVPAYRQDTVRAAGNCQNSYVLVRTWTARDTCGNTTIHVQRVTVQDTTNPVLTFANGLPADVTVNCDAVPAAVTASATDNCTPNNLVRITLRLDTLRTAGACISNYQIRRTWIATDLCGNTDTHVQMVTVQDTTRPTLVWNGARPANVTVNCDNIPFAVMPTATDNCTPGNRVTITRDSVVTRPAAGCISNYTIRRIWTAEDLCGNTTSWEQLITVQDTTRPTLVWTGARPGNITVNCDNVPGAVTPTATDNCTPANQITIRRDSVITRVAGDCISNYTIRRIWTATDLCNNSVTWEQLITVRDTTRPTLVWNGTRPANITVNCENIPGAVTPTATDNCTPANQITIRRDSVITRAAGACISNYTIRRIWTATDLCNNSVTWEQLITVQDTTRPTLVWNGARPANITVNCDNIPGAITPTATDNCTPAGQITIRRDSVITRAAGACISNYTIRRIWTATDLCNNSVTWEQLITVRDTTRPTLVWNGTRPANVTVNCDNIPGAVMPTATDNCTPAGQITIRRDSVITRAAGACISNYTIRRIWTATDLCNNSVTWEQLITVQDTTRPNIIWTGAAPADVTVNCDNIPSLVMPTATDNCTPVNQISIVSDSTISRAPGACVSNYTIVRRWTVRDLCGNQSVHTQRITVQDTTRPTLVWNGARPANITVNCDNIPGAVMPTATDNCTPANQITIRRDSVITRVAGDCISNYTIRRIWTATDLCNNSTTWEQLITVQDTTRPTLVWNGVRPANITVNCDNIPGAVMPTATDNCTPANQITIRRDSVITRAAGDCISNYTIRRIWTATDLCNNSTTWEQLITVQDTTRPQFAWTGGLPANMTVNCDALPARPTPTVSDNCTPANQITLVVDTTITRAPGACVSNYTIRRVWTATDLCGNIATHVQVITVQDTTRPRLVWASARPANVTVNCDNIPAPLTPSVTDNCTPVNQLRLTFTQDSLRTPGACVNNYSLIRTWTVTDLCGNTDSHRQIVTVQDTTRPVMVWTNRPANVTVDCDAVPAPAMPTATDNCTPGNRVTIALRTDTLRAAGACISNYQLRRTWTATDLCGNFSSHVQLVTVQDTTKPVFNFPNGQPADATVSCHNIPAVPVVNATDNCSTGNGVTVALRTDTLRTPGACVNSYRLRRTWTATDLCGNFSTYVQTLTVEDRTAPVFTMPAPADTTVNCDEIPAQPDLTAIDNCSPAGRVTILKNENRQAIPGACANNYLLIRTWTAIDECRNAQTVTQTITVVDTKAPEFTSAAPADTTVNCDNVPAAPNMTATDNCSTGNNVTVRYDETRRDIPGACINHYQLIRTWTATDECGNFNTVSQTITVQDTTAPVFTTPAPANATVECDAVPAQPDLNATDNCAGNVTITKAEQRIDSTCANTYRLIRTWTATDVCGNSTTLTQTIIVADRTKPVFTTPIPADTTVNCDAIPARPVITATDNCAGSINVQFEEEHIDIPGACANNYRLLRTWTANDGCGNITRVIQVITVRDTTRPTFTLPVPADTTVNCDAIPVQPDLTATDNCSATGDVTVVKNETRENIPGACANNYRLIRTWTATDECGNANTVRQVVTVQDTTRPVFTLPVPTDATVDCNAVPAQPDINATDNCSAQNRVTIVKNERREDIAGACANNYRLIRTWTATDECGNSTVLTQVITVQDTTRPNFTMPVPADVTVNCDAIPTQPDLSVTDNCSLNSAIRVAKNERREDIAGACVNNYRLIRTWTATDECGNARTVTQVLTVQDTTRPTFVGSIPANATVECSAIPVQPNLNVTDNCSASNQVTVVKSERREDIPGACVNNYRLIRSWTATDECGNRTTVEQVLTVTDTTAPQFTNTVPADATAECSNIPAQPDLAATDNCSGNNVTVVKGERREDIPGACANNYRLIRTWTATDECGNARTVTQVLTITDNTKPVFNMPVPANATVECDAVPVQPDLTATDNCSPDANIRIVKYERREDIPGACANNYRLIRTWTATDECGNATTVTQVLTVQDRTAPVFTTLPPTNITLSCSEVPAAPVMTATDNCSGNNVRIVYSFSKRPLSGMCAYNYQLTRTWKAYDECGNMATATQVIIVMDTTRPTFTMAAPADTTVMCDDLPAPVSISATDNCTPNGGVRVTFRSIRQTVPGACTYQVVNIWTATDECGNASEMRQVVTVIDTVKPVIAAPPADITLTCGQAIPTDPIGLTATDNCSEGFPKQVQYTIDPYTPDLCNGYTITRRWRVADNCGNQADDVTQRIHVLPCPKPALLADVFTNCSTNPFITLRTSGNVNRPVYTLVAATPANAISIPMTSTNPRFNVNGATSVSFVVRDGVTGCVSDTMTYAINYLQMPQVNLGADTSLCGGNGMVLDAGPANFGYQIRWSTGETTQRIRITRAGTYKVTVTNGMCEASDSIEVGVIPMPLIDLQDTTICRGQSVKLDATVEGNASYLWSTGATTPVITVSTQERFWVRVTKLGCITIDTVNVTVNPPPDVTLSRDTSICPGQSVMLTVNTNAGRIMWATGETGNSIVVSRAGTYQVAVYRDNCVVKEAVRVSERPDIKLELGPDRYMCPGGSILVDARHPDVNVYRWNDGDLNPVKTITQPGTYVLGVLDRFCDRYKTDSIKVAVAGPPTVNLGNDTIICKTRRYMLKANATNASRYLWNTGATTSYIEVTQPGTYTVTAFNDCGSTTDEITIDVKECDSKPEVPNAFSPNGDGKNDLFRPVLRGPMYEYELRIYNRWGEMVFISKDQNEGWNGMYKGQPVDVGTFVWWLTYKKTAFGPAFIIKGDVTVVR